MGWFRASWLLALVAFAGACAAPDVPAEALSAVEEGVHELAARLDPPRRVVDLVLVETETAAETEVETWCVVVDVSWEPPSLLDRPELWLASLEDAERRAWPSALVSADWIWPSRCGMTEFGSEAR